MLFHQVHLFKGGQPSVEMTRQTAAALAGVAPDNRDSGDQNGIRRINDGRGALYMATLSAVPHDRILKEFYEC